LLKHLVFVGLAAVFMACGGGDDGGGGGDDGGDQVMTGPFKGVLTGATETGIIDVTISDTASGVAQDVQLATYPVTGTVDIDGMEITVTGTFDDSSGAFSVSGGGYSFTGEFGVAGIGGSYTGPNGDGQFSMMSNASGTALHVYCGTYDGSDTGLWNLVDGGDGKVSGNASSGAALNGTRDGDTITLTYTGGSATGTVSGTMVTGTWTAPNDASGTWSGSEAACGG
jgi:hypothetical protein